MLAKLGPNCPFAIKEIFFEALTNTTIVYILCHIMLQCLQKDFRVRQIMRYKVLQFWTKLNTNHPFSFTGDFFERLNYVNYICLMYPIAIPQCFRKNHYIKSQNTELHNFWRNWPWALTKLTIITFVNLLCSS